MLEDDRARPERPIEGLGGSVVFVCAEFGVHPSLPIYSGGLGALAGDILKAASDLALPVIGVGLLYRKGYFQQRVDRTGLQHEYWTQIMPERLPTVQVHDQQRRTAHALSSRSSDATSRSTSGGRRSGAFPLYSSTRSSRVRSTGGSPPDSTRGTR